MSKTKVIEGATDYRQKKRRLYSNVPKKVVEFEKNMKAQAHARAIIHAVKMTNRSNQTALAGKNVYYIASFFGRTVTRDELARLVEQSTATATLADGLAATGSPPVERRKTPREPKRAKVAA